MIIIGIQFIPVERTNPPVTSDIDAPSEIKAIFKKACYDCHSNETNWAWYTKVAPSSFLAVKDVNDGRKHLNFSEWDLQLKKQNTKKKFGMRFVKNKCRHGMYKIFHSEAKLTQEEKNLLRNWATNK
ncbi:MAG: heme-binding domain-containing protein [Ignavibacteriales bacterium]|nr:heme-binding domain-containing protein [Ignavibacteriales bacterium]